MNGWRLVLSEGQCLPGPNNPIRIVTRGGDIPLAKTVYIGNLPWSATEDDLSALVSPHATVLSARVATDRDTGRSRGFGFVEVEDAQIQTAVDALQNMEMDGRVLTVNEAKPREPRAPRSGGGDSRRW
jgi:RNA recognition motif-containing protein